MNRMVYDFDGELQASIRILLHTVQVFLKGIDRRSSN